MKKIFILWFTLLTQVAFSQIQIQNLNINEIRGIDSNPNGCADYDSAYVRTSGVVYGNNFRQSSNGLQMSLVEKRADTLLNNRCGIGLFKNTMDLPVTLNEGDSVVVFGFVGCFNGLSQIYVDSVKVLKTGSTLTQPRVVTTLSETTESFLAKVLNLEFIPSTWSVSPPTSGFTSRAFMGTPGTTDYQEFQIRIDNDCDLYGQPMPQGKVDIVGIGGQFNSNYQLLPRSSSDITPAAPLLLPELSFQDTVYTLDEGSVFVIPINSTQPVTSQISCLVIAEDITTSSSDYSLQQPPVATFTLGTTNTNFGFTINSDFDSETDEQFYLKLKKLSDNYTIGQDSIARITIVGTTSTKSLEYFDFYKNSYNGNLFVKLPNNFNGEVLVYNSLGSIVLKSNGGSINQDLQNLCNRPLGIYRAIFKVGNRSFNKTFLN